MRADPAQHRAKRHGTNPVGRLNEAAGRRADVVGSFPHEAPIARPIGAVPFERNDERAARHRHIRVEAFSKSETGAPDPIRGIAAEAARSCPRAISLFPPP